MDKKYKFVYFSIIQLNFIFWVPIWSSDKILIKSWLFLSRCFVINLGFLGNVSMSKMRGECQSLIISSFCLHPLRWTCSHLIFSHWAIQVASVFFILSHKNSLVLALSLSLSVTYAVTHRGKENNQLSSLTTIDCEKFCKVAPGFLIFNMPLELDVYFHMMLGRREGLDIGMCSATHWEKENKSCSGIWHLSVPPQFSTRVEGKNTERYYT